MPSRAVQTDGTPAQRSRRACPICQMQLSVQWSFTARSVFKIWFCRRWARTYGSRTFWLVTSLCAVAGLYMISDDPYYCGRGRRRIRGNHFWGRELASVEEVVRMADGGAWTLAVRFGEWFSSLGGSDEMVQECVAEPEARQEVKTEVRTDVRTEVKPEIKPEFEPEGEPEGESEVGPGSKAEADDDYDLCELD